MLDNTQEASFVQKCLQFSMGEVVWSKLFRVSTLVYFSTRYLPAAGIAYAIAKDPVKEHNRVFILILVFTTIIRIAIMATLIARVYHRRIVTCCVALFSHSRATIMPEILFATVALRISFEVVVVIITMIQSVLQSSFRRAFDGSTMIGFLVVNGVIYFTAVVVLESLLIVFTTQIRPQDQLHGITAAIHLPLLGSLISRFHLNSCLNISRAIIISHGKFNLDVRRSRNAIHDVLGIIEISKAAA